MDRTAFDKLYDYSDMDSGLKISTHGTVKVHHNIDCINQSIRTILATTAGERVRNSLGSSLLQLLFEPMNDNTVRLIRRTIEEDILRHEPRVSIQRMEIVPDYNDGMYEVYIRYQILGRPEVSTFKSRIRALGETA